MWYRAATTHLARPVPCRIWLVRRIDYDLKHIYFDGVFVLKIHIVDCIRASSNTLDEFLVIAIHFAIGAAFV